MNNSNTVAIWSVQAMKWRFVLSVCKRGCNVDIIFCILAEICHALSGQIDHMRDTQKRQYLNNAKVNCTLFIKLTGRLMVNSLPCLQSYEFNAICLDPGDPSINTLHRQVINSETAPVRLSASLGQPRYKQSCNSVINFIHINNDSFFTRWSIDAEQVIN